MRVLVYGAGVLGSYLAHVLVRGGNQVTVLARGKRAEELERDGLVIRHYFQRKTTVDQVRAIRALEAADIYDLIFVVMKYSDFPRSCRFWPLTGAATSSSSAITRTPATCKIT